MLTLALPTQPGGGYRLAAANRAAILGLECTRYGIELGACQWLFWASVVRPCPIDSLYSKSLALMPPLASKVVQAANFAHKFTDTACSGTHRLGWVG